MDRWTEIKEMVRKIPTLIPCITRKTCMLPIVAKPTPFS